MKDEELNWFILNYKLDDLSEEDKQRAFEYFKNMTACTPEMVRNHLSAPQEGEEDSICSNCGKHKRTAKDRLRPLCDCTPPQEGIFIEADKLKELKEKVTITISALRLFQDVDALYRLEEINELLNTLTK